MDTSQIPYNPEKVKSQMRKGLLEFCVLLLISRGEAYANEILAKLKEANMLVVEGTLYPLLSRLKKDGMLTYRWEESPSGPPRKYYSITPTGQSFLQLLQEAWNEVASAIAHLQK
ncbi:MAG: PadR family transcriptional regulator [Bacteroidales bacterium]|nr:PadR family transcriptional regulator [Bacteroidales bacterium]